jgi:hypothetical protein
VVPRPCWCTARGRQNKPRRRGGVRTELGRHVLGGDAHGGEAVLGRLAVLRACARPHDFPVGTTSVRNHSRARTEIDRSGNVARRGTKGRSAHRKTQRARPGPPCLPQHSAQHTPPPPPGNRSEAISDVSRLLTPPAELAQTFSFSLTHSLSLSACGCVANILPRPDSSLSTPVRSLRRGVLFSIATLSRSTAQRPGGLGPAQGAARCCRWAAGL